MRSVQKQANDQLGKVFFYMKRDDWPSAAVEARKLLQQLEQGGVWPHLSAKARRTLLRGYLRYVANLGGAKI